MGEWKEVTLKEVVSILGDGLHGTPKYDDNGEYYFINGNNLFNGKIVLKGSTKRTSKEEYEKFKKNLNERTILVSINGTIGNVALYNGEKCFLGKSACYFNVIESVDKMFIRYVIEDRQFQEYIEAFANGTTIKNVSLKVMRDFSFALPPLPEQKAIASVLSSLDEKIDLLHRQNATLEAMAVILFRRWFVEEPKLDWAQKPLSGIANFLNGLACQKFPAKNEIERLPVLKIKELSSGITENSDWATIEVKPDYIVKNGDVIFAWSASLMVKIWNGEDCVLNQHLFKVSSNEFPKWFYYMWCKHYLAEFLVIAESHATTMGHIKRKDLDKAMVLVPTDGELEDMTSIFEPLIDKVISNSKQISSLTKLRGTLLPKLISGQVTVEY